MGFLRRAFGRNDSSSATEATAAPVVQAQPGTLILAAADCPACGIRFDPLPERAGKRKCPACGQTAYVARVDDVGYIVADATAAPQPTIADHAEAAAQDRLFNAKDRGPMQRLNRARLARWAALGLWVTIDGDGECSTCRRDIGRTFPTDRAPLLPRADCNARPTRICVCRYQPAMPAS